MPAWLAFSVIRLLEEHFTRLVSYEFTAGMEDVLDEIAGGRKDRVTELARVLLRLRAASRACKPLVNGLGDIDAKELATFPIGGADSGIALRVGKYGPYLEGPGDDGDAGGQAGQRARGPAARRADPGQGQGAARQPGRRGDRRSARTPRPGCRWSPRTAASAPTSPRCCPRTPPSRAKPRTGSLFKSMSLDTITLEDAVKLLSLPRVVGEDAEGVEITAQNGRYGPYLKKGTDSRSLDTEDQLFTITLDEALAIYAQPKQRGRAAAAPPLKELGNDPVSGQPVVVKAGRFGEYVTDGEYNATLRKDDSVEAITLERAAELLAERRAKGPAKKAAKRGAKKTRPRRRRPRRPRRSRRPRRRPRRPRRRSPDRARTRVGRAA